jgi:exonuclease III
MTSNLKIRSLNVRGLQTKQKRDLVFTELSKYKQDILLLQETHSTALDERLYKLKWGPNAFFSHGESNAKGICTIIPQTFPGNCVLHFSDLEGRLLIVKLTLGDTDYYVCNIYMPTSNHETEQIDVLRKLNDQITDISATNIILGGDWNVPLNDLLDKKSKKCVTCPNHKFRDNLLRWLEEHNLIDSWRISNPNGRKYTCRSSQGQGVSTLSRIDMFFISENLLNILHNNKIEPGFMTDHNYITITLRLIEGTRGKGNWKFNNNLLTDVTYVKYIKTMIQQEINDNEHYQDKGFLWDYVKMRIRSETMLYSGKLNKERKEYLNKLEINIQESNDLYEIDPSQDNLEVLTMHKNELIDLNKEKLAGIMFRSKCQWAEYGEKNSKYFLNLEKYNYENKHITKLEISGKIVTNELEIMDGIKNYYEKLYSKNTIDHKKLENILGNAPKLTEEQKKLTKGIITYNECLTALKSLSNGKTPGQDGITTDFYKKKWIDISTLVLDSINYAFVKNEMSQDQRSGIITLSPKKNKLRQFLKNWRPITLLTVDYKLLAKALAIRLNTILPDYIDVSQFGYVKDRYIGENVRCVIDLDHYFKKENKEIYALQIDFEKAFDSINWDFMFISLELMNFDKDFIKWVKVLYNNTTSCVLNNGHKTSSFNLKRGVHQGCPLSALLFIILVQVLQTMLSQRKDISGVTIDNHEIKILQMADDTTILTSDVEDIPKILQLLKDFQEISGLKTNVEKTIAYRMGKIVQMDENVPINKYDLTWRTLPVNLLGINITNDKDHSIENNFIDKLQSMDLLTRIWSRRNLSIKGKLTIINSILIPKLIYPSTILDAPEEVVKEADNIIKNFFWNWKRPKIRLDVLVRKIEKGGLKYPCMKCKVMSWKMLWAIRALKIENTDSLWLNIVNGLLPKGISFTYLLKAKPSKKSLDSFCPNLPNFYKEIILNWNKASDVSEIDTKEKILNECLWLNEKIKAKNTPPYCNHSMRKGILYISDITDAEDKLMDHLSINRKYTTSWTFLDLLKIRLTLPTTWKRILTNEIPENKEIDLLYNRLNNLKTLKTKHLYALLLEKEHDCLSPMNSQTYWQTKYNIDDDTMKLAYMLPYKVTRLTTLQALQYKILHKIINVNYWLHKIKILDSPICRYCTNEETIEHFFFDCAITKQFWYAFLTWWKAGGYDYPDMLEENDIILGYRLTELNETSMINCCILIGKKMIYDQKNFHKSQPDIYKFHCELKTVIEIDRQNSMKNDNLGTFKKNWGDLTNL